MSAPANNNGTANNAGGNGDNGPPTTNFAGAPIKTKFGTYEAQCRLLAAVVASLEDKGIRLDYALIARHIGGGKNESKVEHEFRKVRVRAALARDFQARGFDPFMIPDDEFVGLAEGEAGHIQAEQLIHKYFGASTPAGTEFKFREIRKHATALRTEAEGGTPAPTKTPKGKRAAPAKTPGKRAAPAASSAARKKAKQTMMDEDEGDDSEYQEKKTRTRPVSRRGGASASVSATVTPATTVRPSPTPEFGAWSIPPSWTPGHLQMVEHRRQQQELQRQQNFTQQQQPQHIPHQQQQHIPHQQQQYITTQEYLAQEQQLSVTDQLKQEADDGHELSYYTPAQLQAQRERELQAQRDQQQQQQQQQLHNPLWDYPTATQGYPTTAAQGYPTTAAQGYPTTAAQGYPTATATANPAYAPQGRGQHYQNQGQQYQGQHQGQGYDFTAQLEAEEEEQEGEI